jgi:hypothetical protein
MPIPIDSGTNDFTKWGSKYHFVEMAESIPILCMNKLVLQKS